MKTTLTLIASLLLLPGCMQATQQKTSQEDTAEQSEVQPQDKTPEGARYGVRSAIIKKSISYPAGDGHATIYIDDYGKKETVETFIDGTPHMLTIRDPNGETEVVVDFDSHTAQRQQVQEGPADYRHLTPEEMKRFKITEAGTKTIAGKPCKVYKQVVWEAQGVQTVATLYVWEGIVVANFIEPGQPGDMDSDEHVESIEIGVPIPQEKFKVPAGIKIEDETNPDGPNK